MADQITGSILDSGCGTGENAMVRGGETECSSDNLIHSSSNAVDFSYDSAAANGNTPQPMPSECCFT